MTLQSDTLAVLFTDICDTARVYLDLGDAEAHKLSTRCLKLIAQAAKRNGGTVVKTIGDGAMITFRSVEEAYRTASIIQLALRGGALRVKIGMHAGQVIVTGDDVFGDTVNVAARVVARSGPDEILMTRECIDTLRPEQRASVRLLETTSVKGRPEWIEIYRVISDRENVTTVVQSSRLSDTRPALVLTYKGCTLRLDSTGAPVKIGRDAACGLVIATAWASRSHATIDVQRNRFVLTDHSSNGTFVEDQNGSERHLKREALHLESHGTISLGIASEGNRRDLIHYRYETRAAHTNDDLEIRSRQSDQELMVFAQSDAPIEVFRIGSRPAQPSARV